MAGANFAGPYKQLCVQSLLGAIWPCEKEGFQEVELVPFLSSPVSGNTSEHGKTPLKERRSNSIHFGVQPMELGSVYAKFHRAAYSGPVPLRNVYLRRMKGVNLPDVCSNLQLSWLW